MDKFWEIVVVWATGDDNKQVFEFETEEQAERAKANYERAFGSQVWVCVRHK